MQSKLFSIGLLVAMLGATVAGELSAQTYMPVVITESFDEIRAQDETVKDEVMQRQRQQRLLEKRYDLSDLSQGKVVNIKNYYELSKVSSHDWNIKTLLRKGRAVGRLALWSAGRKPAEPSAPVFIR